MATKYFFSHRIRFIQHVYIIKTSIKGEVKIECIYNIEQISNIIFTILAFYLFILLINDIT